MPAGRVRDPLELDELLAAIVAVVLDLRVEQEGAEAVPAQLLLVLEVAMDAAVEREDCRELADAHRQPDRLDHMFSLYGSCTPPSFVLFRSPRCIAAMIGSFDMAGMSGSASVVA